MDDLDLLPLSERKRVLILPDVPCPASNISSKCSRLRQFLPDVLKEWPGLPRGVKFDPSDDELLGHLLAEVGKGLIKRHPFISEFIISLNEDHEVNNLHPRFLPGVKQDGSVAYFFHRKVENCNSRHKRQKKNKNSDFIWHKIGKTLPVFIDGIHHGSKEIMALYMIPECGGKPEKTHWLMHHYSVGTNGVEEDLFVSKIFYQTSYKQGMRDFLTESGGGLDAEMVGAPAAQPGVAELHKERSQVECISAEASTQVVNHGKEVELGLIHDGCLKFNGDQESLNIKKAKIFSDQHFDDTLAAEELPRFESCREADTEDGFLSGLGNCEKGVNKSFCDTERGDDVHRGCDAFPIMEVLSTERAPELSLKKNEFDLMFKSQENLMATSICDTKTTGVHLSASNISREDQETGLKCSDEANILLDRIFHTENRHSDKLVVLALPANKIKGRNFKESQPKNVAVQRSVLKVKSNNSEAKIDIIREQKSILNSLAVSPLLMKMKAEHTEEVESIALQNKVDQLPNLSGLVCSAKSSYPVNLCLSKANIQANLVPHFYTPICCRLSNQIPIHDDTHLSTAEILNTVIPGLDKLLSETTDLVNPHLGSGVSLLDDLCLGNEHQVINHSECLDKSSFLEINFCEDKSSLPKINFCAGDAQLHLVSPSCPMKVKPEPMESSLLTCDRTPWNIKEGMSENNTEIHQAVPCLDKSPFPEINFCAGDAQLHLFSPSCPMTVKSEPMESSLLTCDHAPCNIKEPMSEINTQIHRDFLPDAIDHIPLRNRVQMSECHDNSISEKTSEETAPPGSEFSGSVIGKASLFCSRRRMKKSATNSVEKAMEEDAPGLLQVLLDRGITAEEIKLYGGAEDVEPLEMSSSEDSFKELETVISKLFSERPSLLRLASGRLMKGLRSVYCLDCLLSLIEQARYLLFRQSPVEWGWCRDLQSFIFVFQLHNRIVLERPEYGYATYFYELVESLPVDWQIKRLVIAMKLTNCSRTVLLDNRPLLVGEDLTEGEACVLESYGWARNTGLGTMLNYCDRVVHDRRNEMYSSDWRAKIGKLLMHGYDGGRKVLPSFPNKAVEYLGSTGPGIKQEL